MVRAVERGAHQVVHRGVHDREVALAVLEVFHARQQQPRIAHQRTTGLEDDGLLQAAQPLEQRADVGRRFGRRLVCVADAQTSAQVQVAQRDTFHRETVHECEQAVQGLQERARPR